MGRKQTYPTLSTILPNDPFPPLAAREESKLNSKALSSRAQRDTGFDMTPQAPTVFRWEIAGAIFIVVAGSALHFAFDWTNRWWPIAVFAAVNESIWEHLKLAFWPGLLWAAVTFRAVGVSVSENLSIKCITLLLTAFLIVGIFVSYTHILGRNILILDIGTFALAVFIGQVASALLIIRRVNNRELARLGLALLFVQLAAYSLFTFYPPDLWLFLDSRTGTVGIPTQ